MRLIIPPRAAGAGSGARADVHSPVRGILRAAPGTVRHGNATRGPGVGQASRRTQFSTRYRFAAVSSTVRSLRAHAWHDRNQPAALSSSGRTAVEQRPWSTWPAIARILQVPHPPPRQPKATLAPDPRMAASTVSSGRHERVSPTGLSVIVYTRPGRLGVSGLRVTECRGGPFLRVDAQEGLVQLLRMVENGGPDLILRPPDGAAVRIHLVRGVPPEGL